MFNLIVGTGALTLPAVFAHAGWFLSLVLIVFLSFVSFITVTFIIESIACANATLQWRRIQTHRIDGVTRTLRLTMNKYIISLFSQESEAHQESNSSDEEVNEESAIISRPRVRNYYSLNERVELVQMTSLYFSKLGCTLFYIALCVYLYGDLAIYVAAISGTVSDIICHTDVNNTNDFDIPCWKDHETPKLEVYRFTVLGFILLIGPFTYLNVQKTKYLQILTSGLRWSAFLIMIILASVHMSKHEGATPEMFYFPGVPALIGSSVYSFMCHHSLPGLIAPFAEKKFVIKQIGVDYVLICAFYIILAMTGSFAFKHLYDLYTLNFIPSGTDDVGFFMRIILYFLGAFPIFTLSMSFPIIAITLQNNLKALFLDANLMESYNFFLRRLAFPTIAIIPPVIVAFCTTKIELLVEFTGAYAGAMIQYVIPACLVWAARRSCLRDFGGGAKNRYSSPFRSKLWVYFLLLWAVTSTIIVTINIFSRN